MKPPSAYAAVESNAPLMGLATTPTSTRLEPSYSPNLLNCTVRDGVVSRRSGYVQLGSQLIGRVLAITEFGPLDEDPYFLVFTSSRQYYFDTGTDEFVDLTKDQTTLNIVSSSTTEFKVTGDQTALFAAGAEIRVAGTASNDGDYVVVASRLDTGDTYIDVDRALTAAGAVGTIDTADGFVTGARDQIEFAVLTDSANGHRIVVTNGINTPRVWDGDTGNEFDEWSPNFINFVTCKTIAVFSEYLFLGGLITTVSEPQTIAWSDAGNFDEFETGTSGRQLLYQLNSISAMKILGDRLAIYSYDSIMTATYIGGTLIFVFELVIPEGARLVSPKAIASINIGHVYLSEENFYLFDGTRGMRVLGDAVYSDYKTRKDLENIHQCAMLNDFAKRTIYMSVPDVLGGAVIYTCEYDVYDLSRITWAREKYADAPRAYGFYVNRTAEVTWEDAPWEAADTPWSDEIGPWVQESEQLRFPIRCFGTNEGKVFLVTEGALTDNGVEVCQEYHTMDFTVPEVFHSTFGRWGEIEFEGSGTTVDVAVSNDLGRNFTEIETVALNNSYETYRIPIDQHSRTIRVRFKTLINFSLRWIRLWVRAGGPR